MFTSNQANSGRELVSPKENAPSSDRSCRTALQSSWNGRTVPRGRCNSSEPPRVLRRPNTLRGLTHEQVEQVLARGAGADGDMGQDHQGEYPSLWAAIESIAPEIGCVPQTLNEWFKRAIQSRGDAPARPPGRPNRRWNWRRWNGLPRSTTIG
jgi:hypothetical protein